MYRSRWRENARSVGPNRRRGFAGEFHSFSCFRYNFHQVSPGRVTAGTRIAADNLLDRAGPLEFGNKRLQGIIVFGSDYIFEDLIELRPHPRQRPCGTLTYVAVGIAEGAKQDADFVDVVDLSQRNDGAQTNKPFWIGSQTFERRQSVRRVGIAERTGGGSAHFR